MKPFKKEIEQNSKEVFVEPFKQEVLDEIKEETYKKSVSFLGSLGSVFVGFFTLIFVWILARTIQSVENVLSSGTLSGYIYLAGFTFLLVVLGIFTYNNIVEINKIKRVDKIKRDFQAQKDYPDKSIIILANFLINHYEKSVDKEIIQSIKDEIDSSGIYKNIYESLDQKLLAPIDTKAKKVITKASLQGALCTAISPVPLIDMALILYRSVALTKEVASLYGYKPSFITTSILLKQGIINVMFAGVIELATEFTNQATSSSFLAKTSKQLSQGAVNGILLARLGFGVLQACRPIESNEGKTSFFRMLLSSLKEVLIKQDR